MPGAPSEEAVTATGRSGPGPVAEELSSQLSAKGALGSMGRRRFLVTSGGSPLHRLAGEQVERAAGSSGTGRRADEWAILLETGRGAVRAAGSLRIDWPAGISGGVLELSGLTVPSESWRAGTLTERRMLLLHAGILRARRAGALALFLLASPELLESLESSSGFFRSARGRPSPPGLCWAVAAPGRPARAGGFEAVLVEGRGLERLARFADVG